MKEIELIDSGVQWIREVPKNWTRVRCKDVLRETKIQVGEDSSKYTLLSLTINGIIVRDLSESKGKFPKEFNTYKIVKPNELVFCLFDVDETPRTVGLVTQEGMLTGAYSVFSVRNVDVNFLYRYFISLDDRKALKPLYRGLRKVIPLPAFLSMPIYLPPLSEQRAIADWLDAKCADIDAAIELQQRMIDKLKAYKTAVIHQAVTKGLDKNANLKDSGVQWIGEVPEHWEVCKVKSKYSFSTGFTPPKNNEKYYDYSNEGYTWVCISDMKAKEIECSANSISRYYVETFKPAVVKKGSLLYSFKLSVGQVSFAKKDLFTNEAIASFHDLDSVCLPYLYYSSQICIIQNAETNIYGAKLLNQERIKEATILFPPLAEQRAIADWLDAKCADIDATIALKEQKQEKLKVYKKTIIFEYVTGKKQVANINKQL